MPVADPFLDALAQLEGVLRDNEERSRLIRERIAFLRAERAAGKPLSEIVPREPPPLIVQLITESSMALDTCGSQVRRAEAATLHDEGVTMDRIAGMFGVSRQRVSALLRSR